MNDNLDGIEKTLIEWSADQRARGELNNRDIFYINLLFRLIACLKVDTRQ